MESLALYNPVQLEEIQDFIHNTYGGEEDGMIAYELTSESENAPCADGRTYLYGHQSLR